MTWLCGQQPTMANAQALIGRLHRQAKLQPQKAKDCLEEAEVIFQLLLANSLPEGSSKASPKDLPEAKTPAVTVTYCRWHYFYSALTGRKPPQVPHHAKITARWRQFYFLSPDGNLTLGHSPRRSMAIPRAQREEILAAGKARLSPRREATLEDLEGIF